MLFSRRTPMTYAAPLAVACLCFAILQAQGQDRDQQEKDREEIRKLVADAANRALSPGGLDSVLELVSLSDRQRVEKGLNKAEYGRYKEQADRIARLWREKYNHNFDAAANLQAFRNLGIEFDRDAERDRDVALVQFPAQGGRTRFVLRTIRDDNNLWRIQLPNKVSGDNFANWMTESLTIMQKVDEKWPDNTSEGYINVAAQLLHALAWERQERDIDKRDDRNR
jgi:hypothetical protein